MKTFRGLVKVGPDPQGSSCNIGFPKKTLCCSMWPCQHVHLFDPPKYSNLMLSENVLQPKVHHIPPSMIQLSRKKRCHMFGRPLPCHLISFGAKSLPVFLWVYCAINGVAVYRLQKTMIGAPLCALVGLHMGFGTVWLCGCKKL